MMICSRVEEKRHGSSRGTASLGKEIFFTPRERREAYLRNAAEARGIAERAHSESARERYHTLALFWTTLANEVSGIAAEERNEKVTL